MGGRGCAPLPPALPPSPRAVAAPARVAAAGSQFDEYCRGCAWRMYSRQSACVCKPRCCDAATRRLARAAGRGGTHARAVPALISSFNHLPHCAEAGSDRHRPCPAARACADAARARRGRIAKNVTRRIFVWAQTSCRAGWLGRRQPRLAGANLGAARDAACMRPSPRPGPRSPETWAWRIQDGYEYNSGA